MVAEAATRRELPISVHNAVHEHCRNLLLPDLCPLSRHGRKTLGKGKRARPAGGSGGAACGELKRFHCQRCQRPSGALPAIAEDNSKRLAVSNARTWGSIIVLLTAGVLTAGEHRGVVKLGTLPVPGATVTAQRGDQAVAVLTDAQGAYVFPNLADGMWAIQVEMRGFASVQRDVQVPGAAEWNLTILPLAKIAETGGNAEVRAAEAPRAEIKRTANGAAPAPTNTTSGFQHAEVSASNAPVASAEVSSEVARRAADGFLINGSVNNAATSPFSQLPAFGNNRAPGRWPYNGNIGLTMDNSPFDARPFSLTGQNTPRPAYNRVTGLAALGGPIRIPGLLRNGPQFTLNYQWTRNRNAATQSALMPTPAERAGDFSQTLTPQGVPVQVIDPATDLPIPGNQIPLSRIVPQAQALLNLYPAPNLIGPARFNFQVPIVSGLHQGSAQFRTSRQVGRKDNFIGTLQLQSTRSDNPNLFGFLATGRQLNNASTVNWRHNLSSRFYVNLGYQFNRNAARNVPFFSNRFNVSGAAGGARRLRDLLRQLGLPVHRHPDGSAGPAFDQSARAKQPGESADARGRIQGIAQHHQHHLRDRPEVPHRLCAELAAFGPARSALRAANGGDLSGHTRYPRGAAVLAEHVSGRRCEPLRHLPERLFVRDVRTATRPAMPEPFNCAAVCAGVSPPKCNPPGRRESTMPRWEAAAS